MASLRNVLLLRHGQTASNVGGTIQGQLPVPLNERGFEQARCLANRLSHDQPRPEIIVTSDLVRAMQTAEPIASTLKIPLLPDPLWRERGFGDFEGQTIGERETWMAVSGEIDPPGAEPIDEFRARCRSALRNLAAKFPQLHTIAVVTHGGPIRSILQGFISGILPLVPGNAAPQMVEIINCSILRLEWHADAWSIARINDAAHLDDPQSTSAG